MADIAVLEVHGEGAPSPLSLSLSLSKGSLVSSRDSRKGGLIRAARSWCAMLWAVGALWLLMSAAPARAEIVGPDYACFPVLPPYGPGMTVIMNDWGEVYYAVYRSTSLTGTYSRLTITDMPSYRDYTNLQPLTTYYYAVAMATSPNDFASSYTYDESGEIEDWPACAPCESEDPYYYGPGAPPSNYDAIWLDDETWNLYIIAAKSDQNPRHVYFDFDSQATFVWSCDHTHMRFVVNGVLADSAVGTSVVAKAVLRSGSVGDGWVGVCYTSPHDSLDRTITSGAILPSLTVVAVKLAIRSGGNVEAPGPAVSEANEETIGGYLLVNWNDDNENDIPDLDENCSAPSGIRQLPEKIGHSTIAPKGGLESDEATQTIYGRTESGHCSPALG